MQNNIEDEEQARSQVFLRGGAIQGGCDQLVEMAGNTFKTNMVW